MSVMLVNNEVGTIQPLDDVAEVVRRHAPDAVLHTDAVQALSWVDVAAAAAGADLISVSAHKFGGPKGVGALVVRPGVALAARQVGGGQERERRSGTQNVAGIAAMATAARPDRRSPEPTTSPGSPPCATDWSTGSWPRSPTPCETGITGGDRSGRAAGLCHLCFPGVEGEALLFLLDQARGRRVRRLVLCQRRGRSRPHVLAAMGVPRDQAAGSLRLSLGWATTDADVDRALRGRARRRRARLRAPR